MPLQSINHLEISLCDNNVVDINNYDNFLLKSSVYKESVVSL